MAMSAYMGHSMIIVGKWYQTDKLTLIPWHNLQDQTSYGSQPLDIVPIPTPVAEAAGKGKGKAQAPGLMDVEEVIAVVGQVKGREFAEEMDIVGESSNDGLRKGRVGIGEVKKVSIGRKHWTLGRRIVSAPTVPPEILKTKEEAKLPTVCIKKTAKLASPSCSSTTPSRAPLSRPKSQPPCLQTRSGTIHQRHNAAHVQYSMWSADSLAGNKLLLVPHQKNQMQLCHRAKDNFQGNGSAGGDHLREEKDPRGSKWKEEKG